MCMGPPLAHYDRRGLWRVYPHVYGATDACFSSAFGAEGLSPCVWCHHTCPHSRRLCFGSIPMCMGPPASIRILRKCRRVYPHVYGATTSIQSSMGMGQGLSPCVWGHPNTTAMPPIPPGSIPMCMGPPSGGNVRYCNSGVYPHVYGANELVKEASDQVQGLSPCVWGHPYADIMQVKHIGSIPMCMGPPWLVILHPGRPWVYPHVYGATPDLKYLSTSSQGLSPCVWGHPGLHTSQHGCAGSIPMCMGPPFQ